MKIAYTEFYDLDEDVKQYKKGQHIAMTIHIEVKMGSDWQAAKWVFQGVEPEISGIIGQLNDINDLSKQVKECMDLLLDSNSQLKDTLIFKYGKAW